MQAPDSGATGSWWSKFFYQQKPEPPPFVHSSALDRRTIRLVKILPPSGFNLPVFNYSPIRLIIETFDLDQVPEYRTLSYTWGPPAEQDPGGLAPIYSEADKKLITVNGCHFAIFPNLLHFLMRLRFYLPNEWIWIDAICIDQLNLAERTRQVEIMDKIYKKAICTHAWLGEASFMQSSQILSIVKAIGKAVEESIGGDDALTLIESDQPPQETISSFQKHAIDRFNGDIVRFLQYFSPFVLLLRRNWFYRAWIVQEIALSDTILVHYGSHFLRWIDIEKCAIYILQRVLPMGSPLRKAGSANNINDILDLNLDAEHIYSLFMLRREARWSNNSAESEFLTVIQDRTGSTTATLATLIITCWSLVRRSMAGDDRDKVYSLLGVAHHFLGPEFNNKLHLIIPDYGPSIKSSDVFRKVVELCLKEANSLAALVATWNPKIDESLQTLPSWVPDLGDRNLRANGILSVIPDYNCNGTSPQRTDFSISGDRLVCKGFKFSRIERLGSKFSKLISSLAQESAELTDQDNLPSLLEDLAKMPVTYHPTQQPGIEAFWRTFVLDSVGLKSPAKWNRYTDSEPFDSFMTVLIMQWHVAHREGAITSEEYKKIFHFLEPLSIYRNTTEIPLTVEDLDARVEAEFKSSLKGGGYRSNRSFSEIMSQSRVLAPGQRYLRELELKMVDRRLATTFSGHIANVPQAAQLNDCIVVLPSCRCPVVLRPAHQGDKSDEWILIGPAYVHGIMRGESITDSTAWEEIYIV
jgi:hypothetical protein